MPRKLKFIYNCLLSVCFAATAAAAQAKSQPAPARVLVVVSSHGIDGGKERPGFEMDELSQAYNVFKDNGLDVDIASPSGGAVVADEFNADKVYNRRFLGDAEARAKLDTTRTIASVRTQKYQAVFVIGGKGAMFDLPVNTDLKTIVAETYDAGGVVGAVCHGPAALMNVQLKSGAAIVAGRAVTGFSNEEEMLFGKRWAAAFPILLEDGLRGAGARFSEAPMMLTHVVADGRLVTGQNPYSTAQAAEAVIKAMGRNIAQRPMFTDERSMQIVDKILNGQGEEARRLLAVNVADYDVPLLAAWGFYRAKTPGATREILQQAVDVMDAASPYFPDTQLKAAIADARVQIEKMP